MLSPIENTGHDRTRSSACVSYFAAGCIQSAYGIARGDGALTNSLHPEEYGITLRRRATLLFGT